MSRKIFFFGGISVISGLIIGLLGLEYLMRIFDLSSEIIYRPNPFYGWSHTPNDHFRRKVGGSKVNININSFGMRDHEFSIEKGKGVFRILALGDSFTEAFQVPLDESFVKQMELRINRETVKENFSVQVLNSGVSGFGTDNELLLYKSEGYRYQADIVLLAFCICNDVRNNGYELEKLSVGGDRKPYYLIEENQLTLKSYPFPIREDVITKTKYRLNRHVRTYTFLREMWDRIQYKERTANLGMPLDLNLYSEKYSKDWENAWLVTKGLIRQFDKEAGKNGATLIVVLIPTQYQVHPQIWAETLERYPVMKKDTWDLRKPNRILQEFLGKENILYLDLLPEFHEQARDSKELFYLASDGHWNEKGHELAGRSIADKILSSGLLKNPTIN